MKAFRALQLSVPKTTLVSVPVLRQGRNHRCSGPSQQVLRIERRLKGQAGILRWRPVGRECVALKTGFWTLSIRAPPTRHGQLNQQTAPKLVIRLLRVSGLTRGAFISLQPDFHVVLRLNLIQINLEKVPKPLNSGGVRFNS